MFQPDLLIARAIVLLVAMSVHEFAHTYVANMMGDSTAREQGRMTLDPRANIYWPGFIIGVLIGFAVLGSAPVNRFRMRNPRWGMFWAVLAGPVANLVTAIFFAIPLRFNLIPYEILTAGVEGIIPSLWMILSQMVILNIVLFVFNLLPLAPLDGWTIMLSALPAEMAIWWQRHRQTSTRIFYGLILLSFVNIPILSLIIDPPVMVIYHLLLG